MRFTRLDDGSALPVTNVSTRRCCCFRSAAPVALDDHCSISTLRAFERELSQDGYCYRYRPDERPLGDPVDRGFGHRHLR